MLARGMKANLLILIVILFRLIFKKAPSWSRCILWIIVFARLLIPFNIESSFSAYNYIPEGGPVTVYYEVRPEKSEMLVDFPAIPDYPDNQSVLSSEKPTHTSGIYIPFLMAVWSMGIIALLIYLMVSTIRIKMLTQTAVLFKENIYLSDEVRSPFVLGLFRPHIYLSSSIDEDKIEYVVAHEKAHLKRGDQWWKLSGYLVVCIYWMNPLVWVSYILFCRDLELACDEKVIKAFDLEEKKAYSTALLGCSMQKKIVFSGPLAFGEVGVKERVKNVLNYKKPAFWVIISAVIMCIILGVAFLTSATPEYQIKITIPAGSERSVYYSDEEICSKRNTLKLSCGDNLGDTLVSILPIDVKEENAYDEGRYLTPGMIAEFAVEKGAWFKIGVTAENLSDDDMIVYVRVKNVDVRIADYVSSEENADIASDEKIEIRTPEIDLNATTGADGSTIYYADKNKFIFGGYYGLFVYDMENKQIAGGIDLEPIGCNYTQGDNACEVNATDDGSLVFLHPMNSTQMYIYDVTNNTMKSEEYNLAGYNLYENQYSGDEAGKYASFDDGGEIRYVVLINDSTIGELCYTIDVLSSCHRIFGDVSVPDFDELSEVVNRVGLENAFSWNNTVDFKEDADALIKMAGDETGEYEIYGIMSAEYGTYGLLLNDRIDGEDNWNFEYVTWYYTGAPDDQPVLEQSEDGKYVFSYVYKYDDVPYWRECILDCGYDTGHMELIPIEEYNNGNADNENTEAQSRMAPKVSIEDENMGIDYLQNPTSGDYVVDGDMVFQYKIVLGGESRYTYHETEYIVLTNDQTITFDEVDKSYNSSDINDKLSGVIIIGIKTIDEKDSWITPEL